MAVVYQDAVFAAIDPQHDLLRIAGGNETEVYLSDDRRFVVKIKHDLNGPLAQALVWVRQLRAASDEFRACLGPRHTIASHYFVARDSLGRAQVVVVQPYLADAVPMAAVDYAALNDNQRREVARQLREMVRRALMLYRRRGAMPDLYGRSSTSSDERRRLNSPHMLPFRLWSFLVARNLLRSQNVLLQIEPELRLVLVDYDPVRQGRWYRRLYYAARWLLVARDELLIAWLLRQR